MGDVSRETARDDVSRETARRLFPGDRLNLALEFAHLLETDGVTRGLIGPREAPRLWDRHLLNCAMLAEAIEDGASVADLGSGAGLPGLVLAVARPDLSVTLVEPLERRTTFLHEVVERLGLTQVEVVRGRAESLHGSRVFDVVTSRALAPLGRLLEWSIPLVAGSGTMLAMKGRSLEEEIVAAAPQLRALGCAEPQILELGAQLPRRGEEDTGLSTTRAVRVAHADPSRVAWRPVRPSKGRAGRAARRRHSG